jgi:hypothetical protein
MAGLEYARETRNEISTAGGSSQENIRTRESCRLNPAHSLEDEFKVSPHAKTKRRSTRPVSTGRLPKSDRFSVGPEGSPQTPSVTVQKLIYTYWHG